jgi:S-adenosylmethionine synthetase
MDEEKLLKIIPKVFNLSPGGIIRQLNLLKPIYQKTASYGHFGRNDADFTWEQTDMADVLKQECLKETEERDESEESDIMVEV